MLQLIIGNHRKRRTAHFRIAGGHQDLGQARTLRVALQKTVENPMVFDRFQTFSDYLLFLLQDKLSRFLICP